MAAQSGATRRDAAIEDHQHAWFDSSALFDLRNAFARDGFVKLREIVPDSVRTEVRDEVLHLLDLQSERRDLRLRTTGGTPRAMTVTRSEFISEHGTLINSLYRSPALLGLLEQIAAEKLYPCPSKDEEFLITRQEKKGDTHGWHWGDFSFALIWIIETPPIEMGGMLQCVPHTRWDKKNPQIHNYLCANPIATHGFVSGDLYLQRTDTTLHRTVPLDSEATRIILNMTWAAKKDLDVDLTVDDRWWEQASVSEAARLEGQ